MRYSSSFSVIAHYFRMSQSKFSIYFSIGPRKRYTFLESNSLASSTCNPHNFSLLGDSYTISLKNKDRHEQSFSIVNLKMQRPWALNASTLQPSIEFTGHLCPPVSETWYTETHTSWNACSDSPTTSKDKKHFNTSNK